jgi:hypothetical protein
MENRCWTSEGLRMGLMEVLMMRRTTLVVSAQKRVEYEGRRD